MIELELYSLLFYSPLSPLTRLVDHPPSPLRGQFTFFMNLFGQHSYVGTSSPQDFLRDLFEILTLRFYRLGDFLTFSHPLFFSPQLPSPSLGPDDAEFLMPDGCLR